VLAGLFLVCTAQSQYSVEVRTVDDGLPQNSVNAILQTRDGYIWMATNGGLARYDGVRFKTFEVGNSAGMTSNRLLSLCEDREGSLWIGTENQGLMRFEDGLFTSYPEVEDVKNRAVAGIIETREGGVWMATATALVRLKEQGKVRHVGITETSPNDPEQRMLTQAIQEAPWEVTMLAYSLMNQGARHRIFPATRRRGVGTLLMFVVRNLFSKAAYRHDIFARLVEQGHLDASILADGDPLGFLVAEGAAESITDAAYRYARHEQGVDVVLFGTGDKAHVKDNVDSILRPSLAPRIIERIHATFGHLTGVGLDRPGPVKK